MGDGEPAPYDLIANPNQLEGFSPQFTKRELCLSEDPGLLGDVIRPRMIRLWLTAEWGYS